ncbi:MAG: hypothetical protein IJD59_01265 [Clostridia bacterium]|nr:hypothetical protein [Clostridia bacterium]
MSLKGDLELCLEYAESLEDKQAQRVQAQNGIIFIQNESERLKNKLKFCMTLTVLAVIGIVILALAIVACRDIRIELSIFTVSLGVVGGVALFNYLKTKKESDELETRKPVLLQQYTAEAETCERDMVELLREIYQEGLFDIVPADYFSVAAIEFCLNQVRKKVATTAPEAFRQLDAEIRRLEHMEHLEQMNNAQMEKLEDIERAINLNTIITAMKEEEKNRQ